MKTRFLKHSIALLLFLLVLILAGTVTVTAATVKNGVSSDTDGIRYYVNGVYQTGWQTIDGREVYFFAATGLMCDYDRIIGGQHTDLEPFTYNGLTLYGKVEVKNGLCLEDGGIRYYKDGKYQTGWQVIGGKQVYFYAATGLMCTENRTIGGVMTYFEPITIYAKDRVEMKNGVIAEDGGIRYYVNGVYQTGWQVIGGKQVYFYAATGLMCTEDRTIGGVMTCFEPFAYNGVTLYGKMMVKNGLFFEDGGIRYYKNHVYQTGWQVIGGKQVYFYAATGLMCREDRTIGGVMTYFEPFTYDGITLYGKRTASQGLTYSEQSDGTLIITGIGTSTDTELMIPAEINGKKVTAIGSSAFDGNASLTKVIIPKGVTSIHTYAFQKCSALKTVELPDSLTTIYYGAFYDCDALTEIHIPDSVTNIGSYAFYSCSVLKSIKLPDGLSHLEPSSFRYISKDAYTVYQNGKYLGSNENPYLVLCGISVLDAPFEFLPQTKFVLDYALQGCSTLTKVVIPEGICMIGFKAFAYCNNLIEIHIPASAVYISNALFAGCDQEIEVTVAKGNPNYHSKNNAIIQTQNKKMIAATVSTVIPDDGSVRVIGGYAFANIPIEEIAIPEGVTSINYNALEGCNKLTTITFSKSLVGIYVSAFHECTLLTTVRYGGSAEDWSKIYIATTGNAPLLNATIVYDYKTNGLVAEDGGIRYYKDDVYQTGWHTIGDKQVYFYAATGLMCTEDRTIGGVMTYFEPFTYNGMTLYGKKTIPTDAKGLAYTVNSDGTSCTITGIGTCRDEHVVIPEQIDGYDVVAIARRAFYGCTSFTEITIPASVTEFVVQVFYKASNLHTVYYNSTYTIYPDGVSLTGTLNHLFNHEQIKKVVFGGEYVPRGILNGCSNITEVEIKESVKSIQNHAFKGCDALAKMTITAANSLLESPITPDSWGCDARTEIHVMLDDSVTSIGSDVFRGCTALTSIVIPDSVTVIDTGVFSGCTGLTSITIPDSVTSIGANAFRGCSGLTSITIPNSITSIGNGAFCDCSGLTSITIPDSVTRVGDEAFSGCRGLTSITISNSITSIGDAAFANCSSLMSVVIPDSVTGIGRCAFICCKGLTSITIPNSVTSIGDDVFYGCSSLTSIVIPDSVKSIGTFVFGGCSDLTNVILPKSIEKIENGMFALCKGLTSFTIPDSVTSIGEEAFRGCTGLTSITIPDSVTSIGEEAFHGCTGVASITIPDSVTKIEYAAFTMCTGLTSVTIPDSVTSIGSNAFSNCFALTDITIPDSVTSIGICAFDGCYRLTSILIPDSVTNIGNRAFRRTGITSITIPDSVTSIGEGTFSNCTDLVNITIPDTIESLDGTFEGCTALTSITIPDSVMSLDGTFEDCTALTSITIPDSVMSLDGTFCGCTALNRVNMPISVTGIGVHTFYSCRNLKDIHFAGTMGQWNGISKEEGWMTYSSFTVHCTDGDITY